MSTTTEECTCMMQAILSPGCDVHGPSAEPDAWAARAVAPDAIVVFDDYVDPQHLQEALALATQNWPEWQCLMVAAGAAGVWVKEPTPVLSGPELLDHLRQLDLDNGPHRDAVEDGR